MALKFVIAKIEDAEEAHRPLYKKRDDGKWQLDAEGAEADEAIEGLKTALAKEKLTAKEKSDRLKALEDGDLKEFARLKAEDAKRKEKDATDKGDFEGLKAQLVENHAKEITTLQSQLSAKDLLIEKVLVDRTGLEALVAGEAVSPKVLLPQVKPHLKMFIEDGEPVVRVIDAKGQPRVIDGKGTYMTPEGLVAELKTQADFAPFFKGAGGRGAGSDSDSGKGKGGGGGDKPANKMSADEKAAFIAEHGVEPWRAKIHAENAG